MSLFSKLFSDENSKTLKAFQPIVAEINALESTIEPLSDDALKAKTAEFKERLKGGETLDQLLPEAFAVVRESARRTLNQRHYDVQLMGGIAMHKGSIAEMRTGEGKTLVATLPVYLNALAERGVHVVTVNDYLSRRDAVWMGQVYAFLGLSVGVINSNQESFLYDKGHKEEDTERDALGSFKVVYEFLRPVSKGDAYKADITYGTNNEFGFDYLRDNTAYRKEDLVQRSHYFAIVDEIDSILIDEARTPLIISMPWSESEDLYGKFALIARNMKDGVDYEVDEKKNAIKITDEGVEKAESALGVDNIYTDAGIKYVHHLETAIRAKALYTKEKQYVVRDGEIVIVDEFTGRMMAGRRWSEGLHQAVEAKEGVTVQRESRTLASITYQNYFRMYEKLSGMTGTAKTSAEEFFKVYGLETIEIETNRKIARIDRNDLIFRTERGKFKAIAKKVKELYEKGQPVLIGTVSIDDNEKLSEFLSKESIPHEILNAKNHEREGEVVAQAGREKAVTVATNMAGRGVDVRLGGIDIPSTEEGYEKVKNLGGLFVLGTERHDARRIDNQLRGRSGRQGDPGETQFFVSLEDSLMRIFASDLVKNMMERLKIPEDEPIENKMITRSLESAQEKIEGFNFDARKRVLEFDDVMNIQRQSIYAQRKAMLHGSKDEVHDVLAELIAGDETAEEKVEEKIKEIGEDAFYEAIRRLILQTIDSFWVEHLELMDYTRSSVNLRAYGQRDPLVEYKKEGKRLFNELQESIRNHVSENIRNITIGAFVREEEKLQKDRLKLKTVGGDTSVQNTTVVNKEKINRNDPCPCGSGKKYKKCGMINAPEHNG
jgi:preprotein translocase subunit SecA